MLLISDQSNLQSLRLLRCSSELSQLVGWHDLKGAFVRAVGSKIRAEVLQKAQIETPAAAFVARRQRGCRTTPDLSAIANRALISPIVAWVILTAI